MKNIVIVFFFLLVPLHSQELFHLKDDAMLYDSSNKPIILKQTQTLSELKETYPNVNYIGNNKNFRWGHEAVYSLADYPWIIWGGANLGFEDFGMEAKLVVRWIWFRYPKGNTLQKDKNDYFNDIYQNPPNGMNIDILGKFRLNGRLKYDQVIMILENGGFKYEDYTEEVILSSFAEAIAERKENPGEKPFQYGVNFIDFSRYLQVKISTEEYEHLLIILFNRKNRILAIQVGFD